MFEIGNSLRDARMRRELDFPELEQGTRIRSKYLRALEDENFDQLPGPTYVKGFLRTYADYLGLDGQLYVDEYNVRYSTGDGLLERRVHRSTVPRPRRRRHRRVESNVVWFALIGIAAVTAVVIAGWRYASSDQTPSRDLPAVKARATPHAAGGLLVTAKKGASTLLIVRAKSDSGRQLWNGTLSDRDAQRFDARHGLWVYLASPENVEMTLNGRSVVVGGSMPRSLIVTAGDIRAAGPGT